MVPCRLDLLWRAESVDEQADTIEEWRRIQDVWTNFWPAKAEDKTVDEDPLAAGQEPGHGLAGDGSLFIVKGSPRYQLKVL